MVLKDDFRMKNAYIRFLTPEDRATGFQELSQRASVIGLDEGIFCVPLDSLGALNDQEICYTLVPYEDVERARRRTWHFAFSKAPAPA
jgi:hypothetical protein